MVPLLLQLALRKYLVDKFLSTEIVQVGVGASGVASFSSQMLHVVYITNLEFQIFPPSRKYLKRCKVPPLL